MLSFGSLSIKLGDVSVQCTKANTGEIYDGYSDSLVLKKDLNSRDYGKVVVNHGDDTFNLGDSSEIADLVRQMDSVDFIRQFPTLFLRLGLIQAEEIDQVTRMMLAGLYHSLDFTRRKPGGIADGLKDTGFPQDCQEQIVLLAEEVRQMQTEFKEKASAILWEGIDTLLSQSSEMDKEMNPFAARLQALCRYPGYFEFEKDVQGMSFRVNKSPPADDMLPSGGRRRQRKENPVAQ